jgi:hypothetical protein
MSLISDALFLEASAADSTRKRVDTTGALSDRDGDDDIDDIDDDDIESPGVPPEEQARAIAQWIYAGRKGSAKDEHAEFPGLGWLRQPSVYSDREWILEIALQYRTLTRAEGNNA